MSQINSTKSINQKALKYALTVTFFLFLSISLNIVFAFVLNQDKIKNNKLEEDTTRRDSLLIIIERFQMALPDNPDADQVRLMCGAFSKVYPQFQSVLFENKQFEQGILEGLRPIQIKKLLDK